MLVRPAWAHSCGWKSRRKLITTNEVKRNCMRVTECGEETWIVICEPMDKNRIEGAAEQGERAPKVVQGEAWPGRNEVVPGVFQPARAAADFNHGMLG